MYTSPSIAPREYDVYLVEVDLGHWGRVWPEADSNATNLETMLADMLAGQHSNPIRVIAFNVSEGWSRGASADIARELHRRIDRDGLEVSGGVQDFIERYEGSRQLTLRLS
jgi:hypothetical protein